jgi:hypothetical protein
MQFKSKIDGVVAVILTVGAFLPTAVIGYLGATGHYSLREILITAPVSAGVLAISIWVLFSTFYVVEPDALYIRSGPFRWVVKYESIRSVKPSRVPLSGPALSFDRLELRYSGYNVLYISPSNRGGFIDALRSRAPGATFAAAAFGRTAT